MTMLMNIPRLYLPNREAYLELIQPDQIDRLYELIELNRDYLHRHICGIDVLRTREDVQKRWGTPRENSLPFGLWLNENQMVGRCRLTRNVETNSADIGYWLGESFQGQGLITAAVEQLMKFAFEQWNVNRMEIHCGDKNLKSRAIPERLGFFNGGMSSTYPPIEINGQIVHTIVYFKNRST
ncbi:hypothetical protein I4U23_015526 [Adineta vaga]|nr:hypothetical protein I4U23_015526 [Adineta vaga]